MSNSYAVVPNILPGNVTIGGTLTVSGDFIRIGAASPFARVGKTTGAQSFFSDNMANDLVTRDDGALGALACVLRRTNPNLNLSILNAAGNPNDLVYVGLTGSQTTVVNVTGTLVETTVHSKLLRANLLGTNGGIRTLGNFSGAAQGATPTTFRLRLGGTQVFSWITANNEVFILDVLTYNRGAANSQFTFGLRFASISATVFVTPATAIDTSVDATIALTIQLGLTTDSWNYQGGRFEEVTSQGGF